jgi:hypothetical protein
MVHIVKSLVLTILLGGLGTLVHAQSGAKAMFYEPAGVGATTVKTAPSVAPQLRPINYARPFPQFGHVGVHYWFEDGEGRMFDEAGASAATGPLTLHVRGNVGGWITIWSLEGAGAELSPRTDLRWAGYRLGTETLVVSDASLQPTRQATRFIAIFGRSQTEQAASTESAGQRLRELTARVERDGLPQIVRETDVTTPEEFGTYVVNREGMPLAVEIVLEAE